MDLKEGDVELTLNHTYIHTYTHTYTHTYIVYGWSLPLLKEDQINHPAQERVATPTGSDYGNYGVLNSVLSEKTRKSKANGRNIVGHHLPTLLDVTCCVRLDIPLHIVGSCCAKFETSQTFSHVQTHAKNSQHPTLLGVVASVCTYLNRLQMSLLRQQFLLSYLMTLNVGPAGVLTRDLPPNRRALSQLS